MIFTRRGLLGPLCQGEEHELELDATEIGAVEQRAALCEDAIEGVGFGGWMPRVGAHGMGWALGIHGVCSRLGRELEEPTATGNARLRITEQRRYCGAFGCR